MKPPASDSTDLQRQLLRQLKVMNFWISLFGTLLLVCLGIMLYLIFQIVGFVNDTNQRISEVRDNLDVQSRACESDNSFGGWLRDSTDLC